MTSEQMCTKTVMDTTTQLIRFDSEGVSNIATEYYEATQKTIYREKRVLDNELDKLVENISSNKSKDGYNCILGLSGGVDSSYLAFLAKKLELRPLCIHFDNGWNSNVAVNNIYSIIKKTGFDLQTFVMDWEEFKDIQLAYFKASVLDLEAPTDQFIFGALNKIAHELGIKYILSGNNSATEYVIPADWRYDKFDLVNLKAIHNKFGKGKLRTLPSFGKNQIYFYNKIAGIETVPILELVSYKKNEAIKVIKEEFNWESYGDKHHESVFTRWYQGHFLPVKYNIDKRKAHLSNLILNNEITRDEALRILKTPTYDPAQQEKDNIFVAKKWGLSSDEFLHYFNLPPTPHTDYPHDKTYFHFQKRRLYKILTLPLRLYREIIF